MRDYQIRGLNWMIFLYENGINGILVDEMVSWQINCVSLNQLLFYQFFGYSMVVQYFENLLEYMYLLQFYKWMCYV